jgi:hypothetical protein
LIDIPALWQYSKDFLNSHFFTAIAGACAGAFAGAYGAQLIVARGKEREELLAEIRNTNAATVVALGICNTFLAIKKQHVKRLKETFDKQRADYLARAHKYRMGELPPGDTAPPLLFDLQVLVLPPFDLPLDTLRHQIFEKISLSNRRALMLVTSLTETVDGLNTSINNRNRLIASYHEAGMSSDDLLPLYFGLPQPSTHVINKTYPDLIDTIYRQTNDGVFYAKLLCDDLFAHNGQLAGRFKKRFGRTAPDTTDKPDFTVPESEGLMPNEVDYTDWLTLFKQAKPFKPRTRGWRRIFTRIRQHLLSLRKVVESASWKIVAARTKSLPRRWELTHVARPRSMVRLWGFAPALVVLLGAVLVAGGSFWAAFRQSAFNAALAAKNEEIAKLQQENIHTLKGSDVFHFMVALQQNSKGEFRLMSVNRTDLPIYDVYLIIRSHVDLPLDTPEHQAEALDYLQNPKQVDVGTIPPGAKEIMWLEPGYYQIDIRTRYAKYTEMIKFGIHENRAGQSYIIADYQGNTFEKQTSPEGFPKIYKD